MKKILILLTIFTFAIGHSQYKVAIKANSVEVYDNTTGALINNVKNLTSMYVYNNSDNLKKYVSFYYSSQTLQLYYYQIKLVSVSDGPYVAPTSFTNFVNDLKTVTILNSSGGGGGGGDASAANQLIANTKLTSIDTKTPALISGAVPVSSNMTRGLGVVDSNTQRVTLATDGPAVTGIQSIDTKTPALVSGKVPVTDPTALPLPSGASTSLLQTTGNSSLSSIDTKTPALVSGRSPVDGSGVTQPISASSLPLPTGASTETTAASINSKTPSLGNQTATTSQPVTLSSEGASGTITTQNLVPAGVATAGSAVEITLLGASGISIQTVGTYTGALSLQVTSDGTNWVTVGGNPFLNMNTGGLLGTITSALQSGFQAEVGGFLKARITGLAAMTGSVIVTLKAIANASLFGLDSAIPPGSAVIGALVSNQSVNLAQLGGTTPVTGGVAGTLAVGGNIAHSAATTTNPITTGGKVVPLTIATADATLAAGDASWTPISSGYQMLTKQNSTSELDYNFVFSTVVTTVTPQTVVQSSGTASIRNYIKSLRVSSDVLGAAGSVWVLDGALTFSSIAITTGLTTTSVAHDLKIGDAVVFTALAAGTGVTANTLYYVTAVGSTTTFNFALTPGGANVVPSVAYTGTTMYRILDQIRFQTTALTPTLITYEEPLRNNPNMAINLLIPTSLTSGNIYFTINGYRGF